MNNSLKCSVIECDEYIHAKGKCHKHYVATLPKIQCVVIDCNKNAFKKKKCTAHYREQFGFCKANSCKNLAISFKGFCYTHVRNPESKRKYSTSEERRAANREMLRIRQQRTIDYLNKIKISSGCVECGYNEEACALDFDHVRGEKHIDVSRMLGWTMDKVVVEVAKCEVVCAIHHRIRTKQRAAIIMH